jgi:hypothetical protein
MDGRQDAREDIVARCGSNTIVTQEMAMASTRSYLQQRRHLDWLSDGARASLVELVNDSELFGRLSIDALRSDCAENICLGSAKEIGRWLIVVDVSSTLPVMAVNGFGGSAHLVCQVDGLFLLRGTIDKEGETAMSILML